MRIHVIQSRMSFAQADTLQYYLEQCESVISAKIQNRTEDVTICYEGNTNGSCIQYRNLDLTLKQSLKPFPDILHGFHRCDYCTNGKRQKQFVTEMPERLLHQLIPER